MDKEYMRKYMLNRYYEKRNEFIILFGGKCIKCGSTEELEFDHIDPSTKQFNISDAWKFNNRNEKLQIELDKVQLLCSSCHKEKHKSPHGTLARYRDCKCELCLTVKREYMREYRKTHKRIR